MAGTASRFRLWLFPLLLVCPAASAQDTQPECTELRECIELVRSHGLAPGGSPIGPGLTIWPIEKALARLAKLGPVAADALVSLLRDPHPEVRRRAAYALRGLPAIDPRHLPAMIAAYRRGEGWLPVAIAATGSDPALRFLEQAFLEKPRDDQIRFALARFGRRAEPFLIRQLARCRAICEPALAFPVLGVLRELGTLSPAAIAAILEVARSPRVDARIREAAENEIIRLRRPEGLDMLLARLSAAAGRPNADFEASLVLEDIGDYGPAALGAAPAVRAYLSDPLPSEARAEAALSLGRIGDAAAIPPLVALLAQAESDWLLAYNIAESLGRLRAGAAKGGLERLAASHWFRPVRNNAARALNSLAGGPFELPGKGAGDGPPDFISVDLRFAADQDPERDCGFPEGGPAIPYPQTELAQVRWPERGSAAIALTPPPAALPDPVRRAAAGLQLRSRGLKLLVPDGSGWLAGVDNGEWGGGLYRIDASGAVNMLIEDNFTAAFRFGEHIYVVTGLAHMVLNHGFMWRLGGEGVKIVVSAPLRLPGRVASFALSSDRLLLMRTNLGDVAIDEDGRPRRPAAACRSE
jgi:hypothetical protein